MFGCLNGPGRSQLLKEEGIGSAFSAVGGRYGPQHKGDRALMGDKTCFPPNADKGWGKSLPAQGCRRDGAGRQLRQWNSGSRLAEG